jgi:hypothetical protein
MMTFKDYILETEKNLADKDLVKNWVENVRQHCNISDMILFRGMKTVDKFNIKSVRRDRKPRDMDTNIFYLADKEFEKQLGIKARSQTLFTYLRRKDVAHYASEGGSTYIVIPVTPVKYIYSPYLVDDLKTYIDDHLKVDGENFESELEKLVKTYEVTNTVPDTLHEIMCFCDSYYFISVSYLENVYTFDIEVPDKMKVKTLLDKIEEKLSES